MRAVVFGVPLICACAYVAFAGLGRPAEEVVHAPPAKVYSAFADAFSDTEQSGVTEVHGQSVAYQITVDEVEDKSIDVVWEIAGEKAGHLRLGFAPNGENDTTVTGSITADAQKMDEIFRHGSSGVGDTPAFVMNVGLRSALSDAGKKIEDGIPLAKWGQRVDSANERSADEARHRAATKPMIDPDAEARRYLHQGY
jgi:hypothetical protein